MQKAPDGTEGLQGVSNRGSSPSNGRHHEEFRQNSADTPSGIPGDTKERSLSHEMREQGPRPTWFGLVEADLAKVEDRLEAALARGHLEDEIHQAAMHLIGAGGKRFRPTLVLLSAGASGQDIAAQHLHALGAAAELIHSASLLHDDVVDEGVMRRGKPTSRLLWGNAISVLAGDYCLAAALSEVSTVGRFEIIDSLNRTVAAMVNAEAIQLAQQGSPSISTETYLQIIEGKTATLMAWCASAGGLIPGEQGRILWEFGLDIGLAFQVWDDLLDYDADESDLGKALGQDLAEGKLTLPFIEASIQDPDLPDLLSDLIATNPDGRLDQGALAQLVARVKNTDALDRTRKKAQSLADRASSRLETLPGKLFSDALAALARYTVARTR